jgi:hypothetical protein
MDERNEKLAFVHTCKLFFMCHEVLWHRASAFIFPLKGVLWIFIALKNPSTHLGFNSQTLGLMSSTLTITPLRQLFHNKMLDLFSLAFAKRLCYLILLHLSLICLHVLPTWFSFGFCQMYSSPILFNSSNFIAQLPYCAFLFANHNTSSSLSVWKILNQCSVYFTTLSQ